MDLEALERRIQALEDIEAIKKLKAQYASYCDDNYNADGIANLFVEDGIWDGGEFGRYEGREEIRKFFKEAPNMIPFAIHYILNPIIEVKGNSAQGTWYLFQACTFAEGNQAVWGAARYNEEYVKVQGEWKFKKLVVSSTFWTPFDQGWVKKRFLGEE
jgi:hypothetical protein